MYDDVTSLSALYTSAHSLSPVYSDGHNLKLSFTARSQRDDCRQSVLNVTTELSQFVGHDVIYDVLNVYLVILPENLPLITSFKMECLGL